MEALGPQRLYQVDMATRDTRKSDSWETIYEYGHVTYS